MGGVFKSVAKAFGMGGSAPPPPAPAPVAPKVDDKASQEAAAEELRQRILTGRASTILTSPLGTVEDSTTGKKKTLLGQ